MTPIAYSSTCPKCDCSRCGYSCQVCVWRDESLPDCQKFPMRECDHFIYKADLEKLLQEEYGDPTIQV